VTATSSRLVDAAIAALRVAAAGRWTILGAVPKSLPDLEPPEAIGPYRVTGVLGEGGSAVVYAAEHEGQAVALKVPRERELTDREQERFLEEAKMLARVRHRAVVEVLDSGRLPDGQPFLLMRRYEGETLGDHIERAGALPLERALALFSELGSAVQALHDAGLLHRDLKPENLLLVDQGRAVKLLDFGIAKDIDAPASTTTQAGIARGTPATMAPERFFGAPASKSSDVYELAVILYVMVVGRLPWPEVTNPQARLNPTSPLEAGAMIPAPLADVMMQALSTRPERRPASISELVDAVLEAGRNDSGAATRVTAATPMIDTAPAVGHKSEEAQVIESRRDVRRPTSSLPMLALGVAVLVVAGTATLFFASSGNAGGTGASADPAAAAPLAASETPKSPSPPAPEPVSVQQAAPEPTETAEREVAAPARKRAAPNPAARASAAPAPSGSAPKPAPPKGKPKGAPCTRSSECASMVCAAETCQ
jgi:serine/threonine protein kinase